jgi:RNA polymerase sigma-70 factor (ECF subfamily)
MHTQYGDTYWPAVTVAGPRHELHFGEFALAGPQVIVSSRSLSHWRKVIQSGDDTLSEESDTAERPEAANARFARIVSPCLPAALALARALTGSAADAEDVVQEACLHALRALDSVAVANGRAWVLAIVHNTACTWLSRNRPAEIVAVDDLNAVEQAQAHDRTDGQTPEAEVIAKADGVRLNKAIQELPALWRETLILRDMEGYSYREIAQVMGVPIGTVMSRLARARARLMLALGNTTP